MRLAAMLVALSLSGCGGDPTASTEEHATERARLFADATPLELGLSGPFEANFRLAHAGEPDGIFPPQRITEWFPGSLAQGELHAAVELQVRGNSSLQECSFPKLKLKMPREVSLGTLFEGAHKFKIGTHCDDEGGSGTIGRLRDERCAHREAFVYVLLEIVGIDAMATRPAVITYEDTGGATTITRDAFLLENPELFGARLGGKVMDELEAMESAPVDRMEKARIAAIYLFEALAGNWDWKLNLTGQGQRVWNIEVVLFPDGKALPVPHDFDLSSMVTANPVDEEDLPADLLPDRPLLERQAAHYLQLASGKFDTGSLASAVAMFEGKRDAMIEALAETRIDDEGARNIEAHIDGFYGALAKIDEIVSPQ